MEFSTAAELVYWLHENDIDTSCWGTGENKTAVDLWYELENGESTLHGHPPERVVRVVQIIIEQEGKVLKEIEQELRDGRVRSRDLLPSDKMQPGETPQETAYRCLSEELNIPQDQVISLKEREHTELRRESHSYPGLISRYDLVMMEARIKNLPAGSFWRDNQVPDSNADPVKRHHWGWVAGDQ